VTFADGTFRFIPTNPFYLRSLPAFGVSWDTVRLFAYRGTELSDLPARTTLRLTDSLVDAFRAPAHGRVMSKYGRRGRRDHNGVDIAVAHGQPIFAAFDGIVRFSRWNSGGFGNLVIVRHANGLETYYAHLSRRAVVADEWVRAGQVIGYGGRTGRASANHLHFETRYSDQSFDPERIIDFTDGTLRRSTFVLRRDFFNIRSRFVEGIEEDPDEPTPTPDSVLLGGNGRSELSYAENQTTSTESPTPSQPAEPAAAQPVAEAPDPTYHKIVSGDTLLALALRYKTTVTRLCELNKISRTTTLRLGRNLRIK
jgi:LysM repeat protein